MPSPMSTTERASSVLTIDVKARGGFACALVSRAAKDKLANGKIGYGHVRAFVRIDAEEDRLACSLLIPHWARVTQRAGATRWFGEVERGFETNRTNQPWLRSGQLRPFYFKWASIGLEENTWLAISALETGSDEAFHSLSVSTASPTTFILYPHHSVLCCFKEDQAFQGNAVLRRLPAIANFLSFN